MHQVVGIVLVHLDFFENHSPLAGDVLVVKDRIQYQIAEHVEGDWQMLIQHLHAETDAFFGGKSINIAADRIHLSRNFLC